MTQITKVTRLSKIGVRALNEDQVLVNEVQQVFGVFDGASSLDSYLSSDGKTGAYIAANIASDTFAKPGKNLREAAIAANHDIERASLEAGVDLTQNVTRFGTTATAVRILGDRAELLQIGDSVILIVNKDGRVEVPLGYHDHDLELMRKWRRLANEGTTHIRDLIVDDLIKLRELANVTYGMLNGDKRLEGFIKTTTINLDNVATILLLTDGMYMPKADPDGAEDCEYCVQLYQRGGLDALYDAVRKKENSDPELIMYPRFKLHDDASAVAIDLA